MTNHIYRILSITLLAALFLGACGAPVQNIETPPLRVSWSLWPGYYPLVIAYQKGFFQERGVEVEPFFYNAYNNQLPDLASGILDGSTITLSDTLFDSISDSIKVVLILDHSDGADHIVAGPDITSPADLRGKRIGVQSNTVSGRLLINHMLEKHGILPSEVTFVQVSPEDVPGAIPTVIDAGYTYEPFTSESRARGDKVIFSSADAPGVIVNVLAFRNEIVETRPDDVRAFVSAWQEALQYWKDNPADANALIAQATGLAPEDISVEGVKLFDLAANQAGFVKGNDSSSIYFTARNELNFLAQSGDVTRLIVLDNVLDPSFLK